MSRVFGYVRLPTAPAGRALGPSGGDARGGTSGDRVPVRVPRRTGARSPSPVVVAPEACYRIMAAYARGEGLAGIATVMHMSAVEVSRVVQGRRA